MGPAGCPENSIINYDHSLRNKDRRDQLSVPSNVFPFIPKPTAFETSVFMFSDNEKIPGICYRWDTWKFAGSIRLGVTEIFYRHKPFGRTVAL